MAVRSRDSLLGKTVGHAELFHNVTKQFNGDRPICRLALENQFADAPFNIGQHLCAVGIIFVYGSDLGEVVVQKEIPFIIELEGYAGYADVMFLFHGKSIL